MKHSILDTRTNTRKPVHRAPGSKVAAIGDDGRRYVVWGMGNDEDEAKADARHWLSEAGVHDVDREHLTYVVVTAERVARIEAGNIEAKDLI